MNSEYRFPLFEALLLGKLNPFLTQNHADSDFDQRLLTQIIAPEQDKGCYSLAFIKCEHPKCEYYRRMLVSETYGYCNDLIELLCNEENRNIRVYYCETILNRHLKGCLQKLNELIEVKNCTLEKLTNTDQSTTTESRASAYVIQLLKVCVAKAYLEVQTQLADVVVLPKTESMLYSTYLHELPPVRTFLKKRPESEKAKKNEYNATPEPTKAVAEPLPVMTEKLMPEFMLVAEAAEMLRVNEKTIRRRLEKGEIKGWKDKGKWLIDKEMFQQQLIVNS